MINKLMASIVFYYYWTKNLFFFFKVTIRDRESEMILFSSLGTVFVDAGLNLKIFFFFQLNFSLFFSFSGGRGGKVFNVLKLLLLLKSFIWFLQSGNVYHTNYVTYHHRLNSLTKCHSIQQF